MPMKNAVLPVAVALSAAYALAFAQPPGLSQQEYLARCQQEQDPNVADVACAESKLRRKEADELDRIGALKRVSIQTATWYAANDRSAWVRASVVKDRILDETLLQRIANEDRDQDVRIAAIKKTQDQRFLARFSVSGEHWNLRREAVKRLESQELIQKIALDRREYDDVRQAAAHVLESDAVLATVIGEEKPYFIKWDFEWQWLRRRVEGMKDQEALKRLAWSAHTPAIQIFAAEALVDQPMLSELVQGHPAKEVREAAVQRLTDQGLLAKVVLSHPDEGIRGYGVRRVSDQETLVQVFKKETKESVRNAAASQVRNQDLLRDLSRDPSEWVRTEVAKNLKDEGELIRLVEQDSVQVALAAIGNVSSQELLLRWAKSHPHVAVRLSAIRALKDGTDRGELVVDALRGVEDPTVAEKLLSILSSSARAEATHNPNPVVRRVVLEEMERRGETVSRETLTRLATEDPARDVRRVALRILSDMEAYRRAGKGDPDAFVRAFALARLPTDDPAQVAAILSDISSEVRASTALMIHSPTVAREIASLSTDEGVRRQLVRIIEDEDFLKRLAKADSAPRVRKAAEDRLQELRRKK